MGPPFPQKTFRVRAIHTHICSDGDEADTSFASLHVWMGEETHADTPHTQWPRRELIFFREMIQGPAVLRATGRRLHLTLNSLGAIACRNLDGEHWYEGLGADS